MLAELALTGAVDTTEPKSRLHSGRVVVRDAAAVNDPVLQDALEKIAAKPKPATSLIETLRPKLRQQLLNRLAEGGILEEEKESFLRVFERSRWPAADARHEAEVRRKLQSVLVVGETPDGRTAVLVALLKVLNQAHKVVELQGGVTAKDVKKRAADIAKGDWAADAVKKALDAAGAAATIVASI